MPLSATHPVAPQKLASLGSTAQHAKTMLRPYLRCIGSEQVTDALASVIESLEVLQRVLADAVKDEQMSAEIRADITNGLTHDGICLSELDNLDRLDRELSDYPDPLSVGVLPCSPEPWVDAPEPPLYWKFTPDVDDAPTPAPEPFHSIHPSNCGCDGCVNRGLREVQDAVRRMPVATQAIDIRRPA